MSVEPVPGGSRPSRAAREAQRRHRRWIGALIVITVLVAVGAFVVTQGGDPAADASPTPSRAAAGSGDGSSMLALQVTGAPTPYVAIVAAATEGHDPAVIPVRPDLTIVMPGQGETEIRDVAGLPGADLRTALSNMAGVWLSHYAVMSVGGLADAISAAGGLNVTLPRVYPTKSGPLGPGRITMTGPQVKAFLMGTTDDGSERWEIVLTSMLTDPPELQADQIDETDDADAVAEVVTGAQGAQVIDIPTASVAGTVVVPQYRAFDQEMATAFGTPTPIPAIVQNGNGEPGVGESVATALIPAGFRVTLSQNAQSFDVEATDIFANGTDNEGSAKLARRALGVGRVRVSQVPSGIGDITIVVGKDYTVEGT
jgi:LytR cell envelope-related transcriptional attenuator